MTKIPGQEGIPAQLERFLDAFMHRFSLEAACLVQSSEIGHASEPALTHAEGWVVGALDKAEVSTCVENAERLATRDQFRRYMPRTVEALKDFPALLYLPFPREKPPAGGLMLVSKADSFPETDIAFFDALSVLLSEFRGGAPSKEGRLPSLDELLFTVHELKTPLVAVHQYLQILSQGILGQLPDKPKELIDKSLARIRTQLNTLGDWLMSARLSAGHCSKGEGVIEPAALLPEVLKTIRDEAQAKNVLVKVHGDLTTTRLLGDQELLSTALRHVILNAVRFSPPGGTVSLLCEQAEKNLVIKVLDEGPGIGAQDLPRVFDEFFHSKDPALSEAVGVGLGLTLVRKILKLHGGLVEIGNRESGGVAACLYLPIAA